MAKSTQARSRRMPPRISNEVLDELLAGEDPRIAFLNGGVVDDLKRAVAERALNAEMELHLESEAGAAAGNHRNGYNHKRVLSESSKIELDVPRERRGSFEPQLVPRYARGLPASTTR